MKPPRHLLVGIASVLFLIAQGHAQVTIQSSPIDLTEVVSSRLLAVYMSFLNAHDIHLNAHSQQEFNNMIRPLAQHIKNIVSQLGLNDLSCTARLGLNLNQWTPSREWGNPEFWNNMISKHPGDQNKIKAIWEMIMSPLRECGMGIGKCEQGNQDTVAHIPQCNPFRDPGCSTAPGQITTGFEESGTPNCVLYPFMPECNGFSPIGPTGTQTSPGGINMRPSYSENNIPPWLDPRKNPNIITLSEYCRHFPHTPQCRIFANIPPGDIPTSPELPGSIPINTPGMFMSRPIHGGNRETDMPPSGSADTMPAWLDPSKNPNISVLSEFCRHFPHMPQCRIFGNIPSKDISTSPDISGPDSTNIPGIITLRPTIPDGNREPIMSPSGSDGTMPSWLDPGKNPNISVLSEFCRHFPHMPQCRIFGNIPSEDMSTSPEFSGPDPTNTPEMIISRPIVPGGNRETSMLPSGPYDSMPPWLDPSKNPNISVLSEFCRHFPHMPQCRIFGNIPSKDIPTSPEMSGPDSTNIPGILSLRPTVPGGNRETIMPPSGSESTMPSWLDPGKHPNISVLSEFCRHFPHMPQCSIFGNIPSEDMPTSPEFSGPDSTNTPGMIMSRPIFPGGNRETIMRPSGPYDSMSPSLDPSKNPNISVLSEFCKHFPHMPQCRIFGNIPSGDIPTSPEFFNPYSTNTPGVINSRPTIPGENRETVMPLPSSEGTIPPWLNPKKNPNVLVLSEFCRHFPNMQQCRIFGNFLPGKTFGPGFPNTPDTFISDTRPTAPATIYTPLVSPWPTEMHPPTEPEVTGLDGTNIPINSPVPTIPEDYTPGIPKGTTGFGDPSKLIPGTGPGPVILEPSNFPTYNPTGTSSSDIDTGPSELPTSSSTISTFGPTELPGTYGPGSSLGVIPTTPTWLQPSHPGSTIPSNLDPKQNPNILVLSEFCRHFPHMPQCRIFGEFNPEHFSSNHPDYLKPDNIKSGFDVPSPVFEPTGNQKHGYPYPTGNENLHYVLPYLDPKQNPNIIELPKLCRDFPLMPQCHTFNNIPPGLQSPFPTSSVTPIDEHKPKDFKSGRNRKPGYPDINVPTGSDSFGEIPPYFDPQKNPNIIVLSEFCRHYPHMPQCRVFGNLPSGLGNDYPTNNAPHSISMEKNKPILLTESEIPGDVPSYLDPKKNPNIAVLSEFCRHFPQMPQCRVFTELPTGYTVESDKPGYIPTGEQKHGHPYKNIPTGSAIPNNIPSYLNPIVNPNMKALTEFCRYFPQKPQCSIFPFSSLDHLPSNQPEGYEIPSGPSTEKNNEPSYGINGEFYPHLPDDQLKWPISSPESTLPQQLDIKNNPNIIVLSEFCRHFPHMQQCKIFYDMPPGFNRPLYTPGFVPPPTNGTLTGMYDPALFQPQIPNGHFPENDNYNGFPIVDLPQFPSPTDLNLPTGSGPDTPPTSQFTPNSPETPDYFPFVGQQSQVPSGPYPYSTSIIPVHGPSFPFNGIPSGLSHPSGGPRQVPLHPNKPFQYSIMPNSPGPIEPIPGKVDFPKFILSSNGRPEGTSPPYLNPMYNPGMGVLIEFCKYFPEVTQCRILHREPGSENLVLSDPIHQDKMLFAICSKNPHYPQCQDGDTYKPPAICVMKPWLPVCKYQRPFINSGPSGPLGYPSGLYNLPEGDESINEPPVSSGGTNKVAPCVTACMQAMSQDENDSVEPLGIGEDDSSPSAELGPGFLWKGPVHLKPKNKKGRGWYELWYNPGFDEKHGWVQVWNNKLMRGEWKKK